MKKLFFLFLCLPASLFAQTLSNFIVVDQFGYRTSAQKIAILRNPEVGADAAASYTPGASYAVVNTSTSAQVFTEAPVSWNAGGLDTSSGDRIWRFDFSSVTTPGTYYILDVTHNVKSYEFDIRDDVYNVAMKHAMRSFFYQRSGFAKQLPYADAGWVDGASHIGPLQDKNCRSYLAPTNSATERDLHGGWYDAGDYNKYTTWTGNYIIDLLKAYEELPTAWTDDYNIPESGNGVPDILDEVKWGMDFMLRLQKSDGSLISIVGVSHASPPSAATGRSIYGDVNTSCTLKGAAVFAYGAKIFRSIGYDCYADSLEQAALNAWTWAVANPAVVWSNTNATYQSVSPSGGGDMEVDDYGRLIFKLEAAVHLLDLTGNTIYKTYFDNNYSQSHLIEWYYTYPFENANQEVLLYYTTLPDATTSVVNTIKSRYLTGIEKENSFGAFDSDADGYLSYLEAYTWGSNGIKCHQGLMLFDVRTYNLNAARNADALNAAEHYIHYIHGVNPLRKLYLSNMGNYGAENSVSEFYHTWFENGSAQWDKVGVSTYGPAPGFLVGGANPSYEVDGCCPSGCGSSTNNALCTSIDISGISNQPEKKSYMDFNNSWPINSWEVTENSCGYQVPYIRLLSKFIQANGSAPSGGSICTTPVVTKSTVLDASIFPNPSNQSFTLRCAGKFDVVIYSLDGKLVDSFSGENSKSFGAQLRTGSYKIKITSGGQSTVISIVKN